MGIHPLLIANEWSGPRKGAELCRVCTRALQDQSVGKQRAAAGLSGSGKRHLGHSRLMHCSWPETEVSRSVSTFVKRSRSISARQTRLVNLTEMDQWTKSAS